MMKRRMMASALAALCVSASLAVPAFAAEQDTQTIIVLEEGTKNGLTNGLKNGATNGLKNGLVEGLKNGEKQN